MNSSNKQNKTKRTEKDYTGKKYLVQLYSEAEGLYVDTSQGI